jgi:hypothetical protein
VLHVSYGNQEIDKCMKLEFYSQESVSGASVVAAEELKDQC